MGADPSTVSRRLTALECGLGVQLFERHGGGYRLNDAGRDFEVHARRMEDVAVDVSLQFSGRDQRPRGEVRVVAPRHLVQRLVPILAAFKVAHPEVLCDLSFSDGLSDLQRHQADIALRITASPDSSLVGRRIATWALAAYASPDYAATLAQGSPGEWVGIPGEGRETPPPWVESIAPNATLGAVVDGLCATAEAAVQGMGIARLPVHFGDAHAGLQRLGDPFFVRDKDVFSLWLLTHERLRDVARVRVMMDFLWEQLTQHRAAFEGL